MKYILSLFAFLIFLPVSAQAYHDDLDQLLKTHLKPVIVNDIAYNGVDYEAWKNDPRHATVRDAILAQDISALRTKQEKLAYWINAYNVLTIDLITRENETESIKNLGNIIRSPWKKHKWVIAGKELSLDNIEHDIIRPLGEPLIHFAVNCAAKSCPDLRAEAYRAEVLNSQLAEQLYLTFKNESKGLKVEKNNVVRVTKVMSWFKEDFHKGNLKSWLKEHETTHVNDDTKIKFFSYDWSLNKQ